MKSVKNILFIATGPKSRIESRVMHQMHSGIEALETLNAKPQVHIVQQSSLAHIFKSMSALLRAKTVIVHSPLIHSGPAIVLAKCLRKNIVSFVWDVYPVTINGQRYNPKFLRKVLDAIEISLVKMCGVKIVPSSDFNSVEYLKTAHVLNFWPKYAPIKAYAPKLSTPTVKQAGDDVLGGALKVIFTGQVNATRGLLRAVNQLQKITNGKFELSIASGSDLPAELTQHSCVKSLGYLDKPGLKAALLKSDVGLICLSRGLDTPGFPSKIFDYAQAGLPSLYFGPALESYIETLETSGVGMSICGDAPLDRAVIKRMRKNMAASSSRFKALTCLTDKAVLRFLDILDNI